MHGLSNLVADQDQKADREKWFVVQSREVDDKIDYG